MMSNKELSGVLIVSQAHENHIYELFDCAVASYTGFEGFYLVIHTEAPTKEAPPKRDYKVFPYPDPNKKLGALETATQACYGGPAT